MKATREIKKILNRYYKVQLELGIRGWYASGSVNFFNDGWIGIYVYDTLEQEGQDNEEIRIHLVTDNKDELLKYVEELEKLASPWIM